MVFVAVKQPAQPQDCSFSASTCGAESVPRKNRASPLVAAARSGFSETARLLLEAGADALKADKYGKTPLKYAMENKQEALAAALRDAGAAE